MRRNLLQSWRASTSRRMPFCIDLVFEARDASLVSGDLNKDIGLS
jgi:hypothetical protein